MGTVRNEPQAHPWSRIKPSETCQVWLPPLTNSSSLPSKRAACEGSFDQPLVLISGQHPMGSRHGGSRFRARLLFADVPSGLLRTANESIESIVGGPVNLAFNGPKFGQHCIGSTAGISNRNRGQGMISSNSFTGSQAPAWEPPSCQLRLAETEPGAGADRGGKLELPRL